DSLPPGAHLVIPGVLDAPPESPSEGRLGWPEDNALKGLHIRAQVATGKNFGRLLDHMAARGMNLIVLDVKDADGRVTYPSKVELAKDVNRTPPIPNLARTIAFAHAHGIRVAMRIVCFADDRLSRTHGELAVQSIRHHPM